MGAGLLVTQKKVGHEGQVPVAPRSASRCTAAVNGLRCACPRCARRQRDPQHRDAAMSRTCEGRKGCGWYADGL